MTYRGSRKTARQVIHGVIAVAPLKLWLRLGAVRHGPGHPRRDRRGPIEAPPRERSAPRPQGHPRRDRRGPIEASSLRREAIRLRPVIHGVIAVAPLKQSLRRLKV